MPLATPIIETTLARRLPDRQGKVRDIYEFGDRLLIVASDRISAFDYILGSGIPDKGKVLTQISSFWFDRLRPIVPNHVVSIDPERRTVYVATDGLTASNLRVRHRAAIECDDYFEDWDRLRGLVARARAKVVDRGAELDLARRLLKRKFTQYRNTEIDSVVALHIEAVTSWGL